MLWRLLRVIVFNAVLFTALVSAAGYWFYKEKLTAPLPLQAAWHYTLVPNGTLHHVARDLQAQQLMDYPTAKLWLWQAQLSKRAKQIKAGEYTIPVGTTPQTLLDILIAGKTLQHSLTLVEGWNFRQMLRAIHNHPQLKITLTDTQPLAIMRDLGYANQHPEGRFYPDTYYFPRGMTDVAFLQRAYQLMADNLAAAWAQRRSDLPLKTPEEALILASIVEKESIEVEARKVAGVFIRRLRKNMLLQTDPTVIYALGETFDGNIRKRDLQVDSPYNTYRYKGLPPTPIAMPSRAALDAVLNPDDDGSLFFVAKGNGQHHFSKTLSEHECAVIRYQLQKGSMLYRKRCRQYPRCEACR